MRMVNIVWTDENGFPTGVNGDLSDDAIADLMKFTESNDGNEEYEQGEWA